MKASKRTVVFDMDGALETPYYSDDKKPAVQAWMNEHPCGYEYDQLYASIDACGQTLPHFILPGTFELLRWVRDNGFDIVFFSNAVSERNKVLCPILMERAFGKDDIPPFRILSREDCVDTQYMEEKERARYNGLWHGNYKKKLAGTVVPEEDLPETIMLEDDNSYACRGEERNFIYGVYGGCAANYLDNPVLSSNNGHDFHLPFYFCGMLKRIVDRAEQDGVSLAEASVREQYEDRGFIFPSDGVPRMTRSGSAVMPPAPPNNDYRIYREGLLELRRYNPNLKFWSDAEEDRYNWPYIPPKPVAPPKPKIKTDMTRDEAVYWLAQLRRILCKIKMDNIKFVRLNGKDYSSHAIADGGHELAARHLPFSEADWFDTSNVTSLSLGGYLPIPLSDEAKKRFDKSSYSYLGYVDAGTEMFEIFMRIIREFLVEVFSLEVDWSTLDHSDSEYWSVAVHPMKTESESKSIEQN